MWKYKNNMLHAREETHLTSAFPAGWYNNKTFHLISTGVTRESCIGWLPGFPLDKISLYTPSSLWPSWWQTSKTAKSQHSLVFTTDLKESPICAGPHCWAGCSDSDVGVSIQLWQADKLQMSSFPLSGETLKTGQNKLKSLFNTDITWETHHNLTKIEPLSLRQCWIKSQGINAALMTTKCHKVTVWIFHRYWNDLIQSKLTELLNRHQMLWACTGIYYKDWH